jgi:carbohydrate esterase-like sialic acid-specific acetylesterase
MLTANKTMMRKQDLIQTSKIFFFSVVLLTTGWVSGIFFQKYYGAGRLYRNVFLSEAEILGHTDIPRIEVDLNLIPRQNLMVALTFGQSNAANYGEQPQTSRNHVYNFYEGKIYQAKDPLMGAEGEGGSVWPILGDVLIQKKMFDNIIFVPIGYGATSVAQWAPGGNQHDRLLKTIKQVQAAGLEFTHLFWHQGEADSLVLHTSKESYQALFLSMLHSIRKAGVNAPIYISIATRGEKVRENPEIATAQKSLVDGKNILLGPNTDELGYAYRYDGQHFSTQGLEKFAEQWVNILATN